MKKKKHQIASRPTEEICSEKAIIDMAARKIFEKYKKAFEELAK